MNRISYGAAACVLLLSCDALAQGRGGRQRGVNVARMLERYDANDDGKLTKDEVASASMWRRLVAVDKDKDGAVTKKEMESLTSGRGGRSRGGEATWKFLQEKYDGDKDGKISAKEYTRGKATFARLDKDKDGVLTKKDWDVPGERRSRGGNRDRNAKSSAPEAGDRAPDFTLTYVGDAKKSMKLSDYVGKKPVALVFGSCT